jgi:hypothetical protein
MILQLLKGRGMVSGLFEKKRDAILPPPVPPQALVIILLTSAVQQHKNFSGVIKTLALYYGSHLTFTQGKT